MGPRYVPQGPHGVKKTRPDGGFRENQRSRFFGFPDEDFFEELRPPELFFDEDLLDFDRALFEEDFEPDFLTLPFELPDFDDRDLTPDLDVEDFEDLDFGVARDFDVALAF